VLLVGKRFETPHLIQDNNGRLDVGTERVIDQLFDDRLGFRHATRLTVLLQDDRSAQFLSESVLSPFCRDARAPTILTAQKRDVQYLLRSQYLNRKFSRESWSIAVQPINFMSRSISARNMLRARSTPAWPPTARG